MGAKQSTPVSGTGLVAAPPPEPTIGYSILTELLFIVALALPIGMIAVVDKFLTSIPIFYKGTELGPAYANKTLYINHCLFNDATLEQSMGVSPKLRCNLAYTAPIASLCVSVIAIVFRLRSTLRSQRIGDFNMSLIGSCWWVAMGIVFSFWTNQSNIVKNPATNWRNVFSMLCWVMFLVFAAQTLMRSVMLSDRLQQFFFSPRPPKAPKAPKEPKASKKGGAKSPLPTTTADAAASSAGGAAAESKAAKGGALETEKPPANKADETVDPENPFRATA